MPTSWEEVEWKARKGYQAAEAANDRKRERIWFSPHCLRPSESLFEVSTPLFNRESGLDGS
jgi:hypothetical protein